ncbi:MAG: DUF362 domain-containing protein [Sporomusaceae bacterium]|jgi:uncharacterized protein (DUF362 family)|nr:DUF362 domain-containing protein [Sporomusaceae bacterium]
MVLNRREFLWSMGSLSAMAALGGINFLNVFAAPQKALVSAAWLPKSEVSYPLFKSMLREATDFSWLNKSDSVFIKLALNSGNVHPATTDPCALDYLIKVLQERGIKKIYVGDQSGARNVYWTARGQERGSSRELCQTAGLLAVIEENGAIPAFFEESGYDSYFETLPLGEHHWQEPMRLTSLINEVDHLIYLPRLGSHSLADISSGFKIGGGFLREDSRRHLHQGGEHFYSRYEEINEAPEIKAKLRLTVTLSRKIMTLVGPDTGYVIEPDTYAMFASENLLAHELFAYANLQYAREKLTPRDASAPGSGNLWEVMKQRTARNRSFLDYVWKLSEDEVSETPIFQTGDIYKHPAIINYLKRNQAEDVQISVMEINQNPDSSVSDYLKRQLKL